MTISQRIKTHSRSRAEKTACLYLRDGETEERSLSYAELDRHARILAAQLQKSPEPSPIVLVILPSGIDFIVAVVACFYAGAIAVPVYLPTTKRYIEQLEAILCHVGARQVVWNREVRSLLTHAPQLATCREKMKLLHQIDVERCDPLGAADYVEVDVVENQTACLQYTSGSTGEPRGIAISYGNLNANLELINHHAQRNEAGDVTVTWLPLQHSMGLVANVLQTLYLGSKLVFMAPEDFVQRPIRWLRAVSRYRAANSGAPNFAFDLCVDQISPRERAGLDLSHWRMAYNGAEPVRAATLQRFAEVYAPYGFKRNAFYPTYGISEATLLIAGGAVAAGPTLENVSTTGLKHGNAYPAKGDEAGCVLVSCGRPLGDFQVSIVDPVKRSECASRTIGEIWVQGRSVSQGYWGAHGSEREVFAAYLSNGFGPFLRTGDLGYLREDGLLFITGRLKELIIIDGNNYYPADIERAAQKSSGQLLSGRGAAFEHEGQIVLIQEVSDDLSGETYYDTLARGAYSAVATGQQLALSRIVFVSPESVPRTGSGKVRRQLCSQLFLEGALGGRTVFQWESQAHPALWTSNS